MAFVQSNNMLNPINFTKCIIENNGNHKKTCLVNHVFEKNLVSYY